MISPLVAVLHSDGPNPELADKMTLYSWLIGSWNLEVTEFLDDGSRRVRPALWNFGWVLEGRAIQDVWIVPPPGVGRIGNAVEKQNYYGTTLRVYNPDTDNWHIHYCDPVLQFHVTFTGRKAQNGIVQDGQLPNGNLVRWSFYDISADAFRWRGESSQDGGKTWRVKVEFICHRAVSDEQAEPGAALAKPL
jgi:hypothetical protein